MISETVISEWSNVVPWKSNEQVEQDLVICRALVDIFNDIIQVIHLTEGRGTGFKRMTVPTCW